MSHVCSQIILHPHFWEKAIGDNDIGLIKLKTPLHLPIGNNRVAPICLPFANSGDYEDNGESSGEDADIAGYGTTKVGGQTACQQGIYLSTVSAVTESAETLFLIFSPGTHRRSVPLLMMLIEINMLRKCANVLHFWHKFIKN